MIRRWIHQLTSGLALDIEGLTCSGGGSISLTLIWGWIWKDSFALVLDPLLYE